MFTTDANFSISPAVSLQNINLTYKNTALFSNFNLTIPAGKCVCLLGQSGIGKSSLLRFIANLIHENMTETIAGEVLCSDNLPIKKRIAYMAQEDLLVPWLNVLNNTLLSYRITGRYLSTDLKNSALTLLKKIDLLHVAYQYPNTLSGGMRQRVALARTFMANRPIILMDEPFSALDAITRLHLQELAADLLNHRTTLLVTHDPLEALRLGHIIYVLKEIPVQLSSPIIPTGDPPRDPASESLLSMQAHIFKILTEAHMEFS